MWLLSSLTAVAAHADWHEQTRNYMGTRVHVEVWSDDAAAATAGINAVMDEMDRIEKMMSPMMASSALSLLNREGAQRAVQVPPELFEVIQKSLVVSRLSNGAFDVTFASVGRYYDYRAKKRPDAATLAAALPAINYRHLQLDARAHTVHFTHPGVYVDLGGIATNPGGTLRVTGVYTKFTGNGGKNGSGLSLQHNQTGVFGGDP